MYCMKCGTLNSNEASYCSQCGAPMASPGSIVEAPKSSRPAARTAPSRRGRRIALRWLLGIGIALLVLLLLVVVAGVVAYFWLGLNRREQTARLVPADTAMLVCLSPDPRQALHWRDFQNLQTLAPGLAAIPGVQSTEQGLPGGLLQQLNVDWQRDILPWIGPEVSLAVMSPPAGSRGYSPPLLLTAATRSQAKSDAFLARIQSVMEQAGASFSQETYQGVQITYQQPEYAGAFAPAFATFNHLVAVGSDLETVHRAIDGSASGGPSNLASQDAFKKVMAALPGDRAGYVYVDAQTLSEMGVDTEGIQQLQGLRAMGIAFGLASDGIRLDVAANYDPAALDPATRQALQIKPVALRDTARIPSGAIAYLAGQNLPQVWQWLASGSDANQSLQDFATGLQDQFGVNLVDDVLANLTGEFRLELLPDRAGLAGNPDQPVGILFRANAADPNRVRAGLDDLAAVLENQGASLDQQKIGGTAVTLVQAPDQSWEMGYGLAGSDLVFGTSRQILNASLLNGKPVLGDDDTYRAAIAPLPARSGLVLFVDVQAVVKLVYDAMGSSERQDFNRTVRPYVEPIRAVSLGMVGLDGQNNGRITLFLLLAPR